LYYFCLKILKFYPRMWLSKDENVTHSYAYSYFSIIHFEDVSCCLHCQALGLFFSEYSVHVELKLIIFIPFTSHDEITVLSVILFILLVVLEIQCFFRILVLNPISVSFPWPFIKSHWHKIGASTSSASKLILRNHFHKMTPHKITSTLTYKD